jgi:ABC-type Fe3+/spermidine/putrescine transport system ATPase subunit
LFDINKEADQRAPLLVVDSVAKTYVPGQPVLQDIDLTVDAGQIICLLGPSGCGKTTLLRIIAGLEEPDSGQVRYAGKDQRTVPVHAREFGFMFQDYALFPHKNVGENVAFGLRMEKWPRSEIERRVDEMLALVALQGYAARSVFDLSGGERQRVALARSLAPSPGLLMLDEPLGALDRSLREELMGEVRRILKEIGVTAIYVTHDQQEAFAVADRIVVMNEGRIEQNAPPQFVHDQPASPFVARFLGFQNLLPVAGDSDSSSVIRTPIGDIERDSLGALPPPGVHAGLLLIRPEAARFVDGLAPGRGLPLACTIQMASYRGSYYRIAVETVSGTKASGVLAAGETVALSFDVPAYRLQEDGRRHPLDPADLEPGRRILLALDLSLMTLL